MDEVRLASEMLWRTMNQAWVYLNVTLVTVFLYRQCKDISASFDSNSALFKWTKVYEWSSPGASNSSSNCEIKDAFIAASGSLSKCCWEWFLIAEARRRTVQGVRTKIHVYWRSVRSSLFTFVLKVLFVHYWGVHNATGSQTFAMLNNSFFDAFFK